MTRYEKDLAEWCIEQAAALRARDWSVVDVEHLSEEIEALAKRDVRAVRSHLANLLLHLLKWEYQPGLRGSSWNATIIEARAEIADLLDDSPSLRAQSADFMGKAWPLALRRAVAETGLPAATFPKDCPWSFDQVRAMEFWPGAQ